MGDDRRHQPDEGGSGETGSGEGRPHEKRPGESGSGGAEQDAGRTQRIPPPSDQPAATQRIPAEETPDATGRMPPAAPWSGRAGVPPPRPAAFGTEPTPQWYDEERSGRPWWLPILLGTVTLLLVGVLGIGLWLIVGASQDGDPDDVPSAPATSTSVRTPLSPPVSTASAAEPSETTTTTAGTPTAGTAPATTPPPASTAAPPTSAGAELPMPPLVGLPRAAAEAVLDRLGLGYRVRTTESLLPAGTVVATDPRPGRPVRVGQEVTLEVAVARPMPTPPGRGGPDDLPGR